MTSPFYFITQLPVAQSGECGYNETYLKSEEIPMPLDGLTLGFMARELNHTLCGGRIGYD